MSAADEEPVENLVVTASPVDRSADELAKPVTVIDRDELLRSVTGSLGDELATRAGIGSTGYAAGASRPVIRGQDSSRVRVLENGVGTQGVADLSPDHAEPINPLTAQRVEIVRGPAGLRYGGGAIAGVVNALTGRIPTELATRRLQGELYSAYGFSAQERDAALVLEGAAGTLGWHIDALKREGDDYEVPGSEREVEGSDTDSYSLSAGAAWIGERGRVGFAVSRFDSEYGIPAPEDPNEPLSLDAQKDQLAFEADWLAPRNGVKAIKLRGAFSEYQHRELINTKQVQSRFDNDELEIRTELLHEPIAGFEGAFGFQHQDRDLKADGEGADLLPPSERRSTALFVFEELPISDALRLEVGARAERTRLDGFRPDDDTSVGRTYTPLSASLAAVYDSSDTTRLGLTLSGSQRAPDPFELFSQGPHDATETFEIGDADHDEETSYTADLSLRHTRGPFTAELSVFYTDYDDFIFGQLTGRSRDEDGTVFADIDTGELRELRYVQGDARFTGAELEASVELLEIRDGSLALEGQADFVRARLSSGNVPRIPPRRFGLALAYRSPRLDARIGFLDVAAQNRLDTIEDRTSGYTTVDASLRFQLLERADRPVDLVVSARNLGDVRARNHVSFKKDDVLLPGRAIRVALHARF